jgi:thiamine pyrophosphate-dependent acetolactate synthase large subunit-like protein
MAPSLRANDGIVTAIDPRPDYARIAEACGAFGATVCEPSELQPTLRRALDEVQHGRSAVVDAVLRPI